MIRKGGPAWDNSRPLREQDEWDEHASFMDGLFDERFLVAAGPLGDGAPEHRGRRLDRRHRSAAALVDALFIR